MPLSEVSYPVTGSIGTYQNSFPSQKPLFAEFLRRDNLLTSISSGTGNNVRLQSSSNYVGIEVGQYITWGSDGYATNSARVTAIIAANIIEVDVQFVSGDATNGFVNHYTNYFVEIRYVEAASASNDQDATEILDDYSQVPNNKEGEVNANISYPSDLLIPDFDILSGTAADLTKTFKIQYRESWDTNRLAAWVSPSLDIPILLVHGSVDFTVNAFTDADITKRYFKGYPLLNSLIYSNVNDQGVNLLRIIMSEYALDKTLIQETDIDSLVDFNGAYLISVDTETLNASTTFVDFRYVLTSNNAQYDPTQYDPTQYA